MARTEDVIAEHELMMRTNETYYQSHCQAGDPPWVRPPIRSQEELALEGELKQAKEKPKKDKKKDKKSEKEEKSEASA